MINGVNKIAVLAILFNAALFGYMTDLNYDNSIDMIDLSIISANWLEDGRPVATGECGDENHPYLEGDIDGDCFVGFDDIKMLISDWTKDDYILSGTQILSNLKTEHFSSPDHQWSKWVVANFSPTRIHFAPWTDQQRQQFLDEYVPDHICEWAGPSVNRGDFCRSRGIAANTTHEYGANEELNELKGHTFAAMKDNGLAVKENGTYANGGWDGTYLLCRNAPKWMELSKQSSGRQAVYGDSIFHDKFGTTLSWLDQGYCRWCNKKFKEYMLSRFTHKQLWDMGFNKDTFDLSKYVAAKRKIMTAEELLEEPVIHEYIRFQYLSQLRYSVEIIDNYHKSAEKAGRPIPAFYGNIELLSGARPYPIAVAAHVDIVWSEQSVCYQRPLDPSIQAFSTLLWKMGRAVSNYEKAVWAVQYQAGSPDERPFGFGADKKYPTVLALAEATANGGVMCQTWTATAYNVQNVSETLLDGHRHHSNFVSQNRGLFVDRTSVADCALVYSVPSMFWRYCYKLKLPDYPHVNHFAAAGRLLEDKQIPYNVVLFGHKDVYDDAEDLASLANYKTIIIPSADCISDAQAAAISDWTRSGGKLVLWGYENVGTRDEELAMRSSRVFNGLIANPGAGTVETLGTVDAESFIASGSASMAFISKIADPVSPVIQSNLPQTVWLNVWRHGAGPMTTVQMFNNALNVEDDSYTPVQNITIRLREPVGVNFTQARYLNTGYSGAVPNTPIVLPFTRAGGYVEAQISQLDMFGILIFSADDEFEARMQAAQTRKWYERLKIALRCDVAEMPGYTSLLSDCEALLSQIQGNLAVSDFGSLMIPLTAKGGDLQAALNCVTDYVAAAQNADTAAAVNVEAYKKFDFGHSGALPGWTEVTTTSKYDPAVGYGWDDSSFFTSKRKLSETFTGEPDGIFPDNLELKGWGIENYDSTWGSDLKNAAFNQSGQLLLTADINEACQGLKYYLPDNVKDWENEWTIIPLGPRGGGYWSINVINGASSYGRFQIFFGRDGNYQLLAKAGTSGWTNIASANLPSMPDVVKIRFVWDDETRKLSVYYGINGADANVPLVLNYSQNEPVGSTLINLRNFEWGFGTVSIPGNNVYQTLVDEFSFEGEVEGVSLSETFSGSSEGVYSENLDLIDWVFDNYDNNWGTDLKNAVFNDLGQLMLTANKAEACQSLKYNVSADITNWENEWTIKPIGAVGSGFWVINVINGASSYNRMQVYFGKDGDCKLSVYGGSSGWTLVTSKDLVIMPEAIKIRFVWNDSTNKMNIYYGVNGAEADLVLLANYSQSEPVGSKQIFIRNLEWDFGMTGVPGNHTYQTLLDEWTFEGDLIPTVGTAVNHLYPDQLHRDFIRSKDPIDYATGYPGNRHFPYTEPQTNPGHFKVDLTNGEYVVTVVTGDYQEFRTATGGPANEGRTSMTRVEAEGAAVFFGNRCRSGYFQNNSFPVTVGDGQLNLKFSGQAVGPLYCNPIEWLVNAVIIQTPAQTLTPLAQLSLERSTLFNDCAIRTWNILGPFDDDDCTGIEMEFGPERSDDLSETYIGKSGQIAWQSLPELQGFAPYIDFTDHIDDVDEVAGFAVCYVYCPAATEAKLVCSMSQSGIVYLNNRQIFKDELAAGLLPDEQYVQLNLEQGWNSLIFKSLNHWGYEWKLWAGLLTPSGNEPLVLQPGVLIVSSKED